MHPFFTPPPENIRIPNGFLMLSWGKERVHWEQMVKRQHLEEKG